MLRGGLLLIFGLSLSVGKWCTPSGQERDGLMTYKGMMCVDDDWHDWVNCVQCPTDVGPSGPDGSFSNIHEDNRKGQCKCGVPNDAGTSNKIMGGEDIMQGELPWMVGLPRCGGTLVSNRHVITAAHCVGNCSGFNDIMKVSLGKTNQKTDPGMTVSVSEVIIHPEWFGHCKQRTEPYDIAILVLASPVDLRAYPHIKPVCLPKDSKQNLVGKRVMVSGWGRNSGNHLKKLVKTIIQKNYPESQLAAQSDSLDKDSCQGDSGGPLIMKDDDNNGAATLVGAVSGGDLCSDPDSDRTGVYADVVNMLPWIKETMSKDSSFTVCPPPDTSTWDLY